ncbi:hypothetical protein [Sphingomonas parapaucimobilis]
MFVERCAWRLDVVYDDHGAPGGYEAIADVLGGSSEKSGIASR